MKTVYFLQAKCSGCQRDFFPRYDLAADDKWVLTRGLKELPAGSQADSSREELDISDARKGPQYKCPWCGNKSFVKCVCKKLSCYSGSGPFSCVHCGHSGQVSGYITNVNTSGSGSGQ